MNEIKELERFVSNEFEKVKNSVQYIPKNKIKYSFLFYLLRILLLVPIILFLYFKFGLFLGITQLYAFVYNSLYNFGGNLIYHFGWVLYIVATSLIFVIIIYMELIFASIKIIFSFNFDKEISRYRKETLFIIFLITFYLLFSQVIYLGIYGDTKINIRDPINKTKSSIFDLVEMVKCSTDIECLQKKQKEKNVKQTQKNEFQINFQSNYNFDIYKQDLEKEEYIWPLEYKIMVKGGKLKINSVECYYEKKSNKNLFYKLDFENEIIKTQEEIIFDKAACDLSKLPNTDLEKKNKVKIIPVLEYEIEGLYEEKIGLINYELLESKTPKRINELKTKYNIEPIKSIDLFEVKRIISPSLPLIFRDGEPKKVVATYTFNQKYNFFGRIKKATLEEVVFPNYSKFDENLKLPKTLPINEGHITLRFVFEEELPNNQKKITIKLANFKIKFVLEKEDYFYINLVDIND